MQLLPLLNCALASLSFALYEPPLRRDTNWHTNPNSNTKPESFRSFKAKRKGTLPQYKSYGLRLCVCVCVCVTGVTWRDKSQTPESREAVRGALN